MNCWKACMYPAGSTAAHTFCVRAPLEVVRRTARMPFGRSRNLRMPGTDWTLRGKGERETNYRSPCSGDAAALHDDSRNNVTGQERERPSRRSVDAIGSLGERPLRLSRHSPNQLLPERFSTHSSSALPNWNIKVAKFCEGRWHAGANNLRVSTTGRFMMLSRGAQFCCRFV